MTPTEIREREYVLWNPSSRILKARVERLGFAVAFYTKTRIALGFVHPSALEEVLNHDPSLKPGIVRLNGRVQVMVTTDCDHRRVVEMARKLYDIFHGYDESISVSR